jgi:hypothetical protein
VTGRVALGVATDCAFIVVPLRTDAVSIDRVKTRVDEVYSTDFRGDKIDRPGSFCLNERLSSDSVNGRRQAAHSSDLSASDTTYRLDTLDTTVVLRGRPERPRQPDLRSSSEVGDGHRSTN